MMVNIKV